jgi:menaquinone-9 beta-reductase
MASPAVRPGDDGREWDAVVVGASLAGCATAIALGRAGARVALVERRPDPAAFKRICGHFIHPSALPALERLGLLEPLTAAGAVRTRLHVRSPWGEVPQPAGGSTPPGVNLRREIMDPIVRAAAADAPGVELMLGRSVEGLLSEHGRVSGVELAARDGARTRLRARLVVGADGRASKVAKLAAVPAREAAHGRFNYAAYFEDDGPADLATVWMADPQWGARFPTDSGLTLYACMPTMDRLPEFKDDLERAFMAFMEEELPGPPSIGRARMVTPFLGKISMPDVWRRPTLHGLALVGDAALTSDPLAGVGCGWAFEGGVRLADTVAPALLGDQPLDRALARYRRRHLRALAAHAWLIDDYATGRPFTRFERALFRAAAHDDRVADRLHELGSRRGGPERMAPALPRVLLASMRAG